MNKNNLTNQQLKDLDSLFNLVSNRQLKDFGNISASNISDGSLVTSCDLWSDKTIVQGLSKIADAESEEYSYKNLKNVLTTNISKAYLNLKLNEEKIISSFKEIESSKESVRLSRLRYDVGISTLKDVLVRQSELSNAKSKNINAIYNYNSKLDELERLTFLEINKNCLDDNNKVKDRESICNITR